MSDELDPHEGAQHPWPDLPFDWRTQQAQVPMNRYYRRRKAFRLRFTLPVECGPVPQEMSASQARAYLEAEITRLRTIHQRARTHEPKECYFDPLPIDLFTGLPPGEHSE